MKVGTDGVLLGAWAGLSPDDRIALDVGTGTGLIALMLAQRMAASACSPVIVTEGSGHGAGGTTPGISLDTLPDEKPERENRWEILGVDIDEAAAGEAAANFAASPWASRLAAHSVSLQTFVSKWEQKPSFLFPTQTPDPVPGTNTPDFVPETLSDSGPDLRFFDLIVSNPPFFSASLKAPEARRRAARHDDTLPPAELIAAARRLLAPSGRLAVIYPPEEARAFVMEAEAAGLYLNRLTRVISVAGQPPKRHLMEFTRTAALPTFSDLVLHDGPGAARSTAYLALTADFYLDD